MKIGDSQSEHSREPLVVHDDGSRNEGFIPQLFTSVPALNEAASYLAETTSYFTRCFAELAERPLTRDSSINGQELETFSSGQTVESFSTNPQSSLGSDVFDPSDTIIAVPSIHDGIVRGSTDDSSQNNNGLVESNHSAQSGFPLFQRHQYSLLVIRVLSHGIIAIILSCLLFLLANVKFSVHLL